jgi:hypothetical protein
MIHKEAPNDLRAQGKEVQSVFTAETAHAEQPEIQLIYQGGGLQSMIRSAAAQVLSRNSTELRVNQRHKAVDGLLVAVAPRDEQAGDVLWTFGHGS